MSRYLLAAFGDPGHTFPAIALGRELALRGHDVTLQTWRRWEEDVEREGMRFAAAPEYPVFPTRERPLRVYEAVALAAHETLPLVQSLEPDAVVSDILTLGPALAAEAAGRPWATLIPHLMPTSERGLPPYSVGAVLPRTPIGSALWRLAWPLLERGEQRGRRELNAVRAELGLPPLERVHGGISPALAIVATFPQLEYPRAWERRVRVTGPLLWEQPYGDTEAPPGSDPLVLVAPSTSQDPSGRLLRAALTGLADEPVRILATTNRRPPAEPLPVPANARLVDWVSYTREMPRAAAVVCHAGHGTLARAFASGTPVVACPEAGDMAENAARARWAGVGVSLPRRLVTPRGIRLGVRRVLAESGFKERAGELRGWSARHRPASVAADAVEAFARG